MKKLTAFALALAMALGLLSGCGSSNSDSNTPSGDDASDAAAKTKLVVATSPDFAPYEFYSLDADSSRWILTP